MTAEPVELDALLAARERMIAELHASLDAEEREFLLSLARNAPNWALLGIEHLEQLPGIRWKLSNLEPSTQGRVVGSATDASAPKRRADYRARRRARRW